MSFFKPGDRLWDGDHRKLLGFVAENGAVFDYDRHLIGRVDPKTGTITDSYGLSILGHVHLNTGQITDADDRTLLARAFPNGAIFDVDRHLLGWSEGPRQADAPTGIS